MPPKRDLLGRKFGRLTVIGPAETTSGHKSRAVWQCLCECGTLKNIRAEALIRGATQSCGCFHLEVISKHKRELAVADLLQKGFDLISEYKTYDAFPATVRCLECGITKEYCSVRTAVDIAKCYECHPAGRTYTRAKIDAVCAATNYLLISMEYNEKAGSHSLLQLQCRSCKTNRTVDYVPNLVRYPNCSACVNRQRAQEFERDRENKKRKKVLEGPKIPKNGKRNRRYSLEEVKETSEKAGFQYLDTHYNNAREKHTFQCSNGHIINVSFGKIRTYATEGRDGCLECFHAKQRHTTEFIKEELRKRGFEFMDAEYKNSSTKHSVKCLTCGICFKPKIDGVINGGHGCPTCNKKLHERKTGEFLREILPQTIEIVREFYIGEKIIVDGKLIQNRLFVDYAFEYNGIRYFIEYNGDQHYGPVKFGSMTKEQAIDKFAQQQIRDQWLREYCKRNGIFLLEIDGRKGAVFGKNIKGYLEETLLPLLHLKAG